MKACECASNPNGANPRRVDPRLLRMLERGHEGLASARLLDHSEGSLLIFT
jgi:hypothetical protein